MDASLNMKVALRLESQSAGDSHASPRKEKNAQDGPERSRIHFSEQTTGFKKVLGLRKPL